MDGCLLLASTNPDLIVITLESVCQILSFTINREGNKVRLTQECFLPISSYTELYKGCFTCTKTIGRKIR